MSEHINYINTTMSTVNAACSDLYESFFEEEDDIVKSIDSFIAILNDIKDPYIKGE